MSNSFKITDSFKLITAISVNDRARYLNEMIDLLTSVTRCYYYAVNQV